MGVNGRSRQAFAESLSPMSCLARAKVMVVVVVSGCYDPRKGGCAEGGVALSFDGEMNSTGQDATCYSISVPADFAYSTRIWSLEL